MRAAGTDRPATGVLMGRVVGTMRLAVMAVALAGGAGVAAAQQARPAVQQVAAIPQPVRAIAGAWDVTDLKTKRVCRVNLAASPSGAGYVLGAPPTCRRTLPAIAPALAWTFGEDQTIGFLDKDGGTVATFKPDAARRAFRAPVGEATLEMKAIGRTGEGEREDIIAKALTEAKLADLPPLNAAALPGLYSVAREKNKPVCSMDLGGTPAARRGQYVAKLSGGCIDGGMKVFDPISWYTDRGRLYLVARKGHEQRFAPDKDGIFQKDPPSGAQLFLKKQ